MNKGLRKAQRCKTLKDAGNVRGAQKANCPWASDLGATTWSPLPVGPGYRTRKGLTRAKARSTKRYCKAAKTAFYRFTSQRDRRNAHNAYSRASERGCAWVTKLPMYG